MLPPEVSLIGVPGIPEIEPGTALAETICGALDRAAIPLIPGDVLVVAQKIISKAEGRIVRLDDVQPSAFAHRWARAHDKDPRLVEVVLRESKRIVRMDRGHLIVETSQGFVCANAGVDRSNTTPGAVTLLPLDCDSSARRLRNSIGEQCGVSPAIIVSDTFGRPWREGLANVALGVAGLAPLIDYRGQLDSGGRALDSTQIAIVDEIAAAAELVMGKLSRLPVVVVRGVDHRGEAGKGADLIRQPDNDLFR